MTDQFDDEEGEEYAESKFGGFDDYFRRKKVKLQNLDAELRASSGDKPQIFRDVVVHIIGYTQPSLQDLHRMVVSHGGGFLQYLDGKTSVSHIIASALTPKKQEQLRNYRVVKPAWVVESIQAGRILPWTSYRLIPSSQSQRTLAFENDVGPITQAKEDDDSHRDRASFDPIVSQSRSNSFTSPSSPKTPQKKRPDQSLTITSNDATEDDLPSPPGRAPPVSPIPKTPSFIMRTPASAAKPALQEPPPTTPLQRNDAKSASPSKEAASRHLDANDPQFIKKFYEGSRLHHLSTWKSQLKAQLQTAANNKALARQDARKRAPGARKYILHVDFDSFFAAVTMKKNPDLADKPVAVAHGSGPSAEIASCNYPARGSGVKNGMWMKYALDLCPKLTVVPYDFPAYEDASRKFYDIILSVGGIVQSVSIDEALIDVSTMCIAAGGSNGIGISEGSIWREQTKADEIARQLRSGVKKETGCEVSVGIGGNILQAKVALRKAKPAGQYQLKPDEVLGFIGNLTVQELPGIAHSLGVKLEELGIKYVRDIRELSKERLMSSMGPKTGEKLHMYARGIDPTEVGQEGIRKSVSAEINWGIRFVNNQQAEEFIQNLCDELQKRLFENRVKGTQLTMRIMRRSADAPVETAKYNGHGKCDVFNKSVRFGIATNDVDTIKKEAIGIFRNFNFPPADLRGLGVQMTKLEPLKGMSAQEQASSQKKLDFSMSLGNSPSKAAPKMEPTITATNDPEEIQSPRKGDTPLHSVPKPNVGLLDRGQKPLNITGTQFILPSQVDEETLNELPNDIRSRLMAQAQKPPPMSPDNSPSRRNDRGNIPGLPPAEELDQEMLAELPEDVRAELLQYYDRESNNITQDRKQEARAVGSASPSAVKVTRPRPTAITPTKPRFAKTRSRPSLMQTSLDLLRKPEGQNTLTETEETPEEISPDFLEALPEDIRKEVLEEHRRPRRRQRPPFAPRSPRKPFEPRPPPKSAYVHLPPNPEKPSFTSKKLSTLSELREAVSQWFSEFSDEAPVEEDVGALTRYLERVVLEEQDISKATTLVNWLGWLINEASAANNEKNKNDQELHDLSKAHKAGDTNRDHSVLQAWKDTHQQICDVVNSAVKTRGLPTIIFD